ncbi:MAG TPA: ribose 5-phosphate isomerase B [Terriglobales bacterium]|nr:ribose 5-phosphate isomerase B [Terriglobales bacterium]
MKIAIASDHAGVEMKQRLAAWLRQTGHAVDDHGPRDALPVDYADYARPVAQAVAGGASERGVLICGSGIGMAMAANRVAGVRAVNVYDAVSARLSREHNDANVITLGARTMAFEEATQRLTEWLTIPFSGGRHAARVAKIEL